jgi:hypothetical protein
MRKFYFDSATKFMEAGSGPISDHGTSSRNEEKSKSWDLHAGWSGWEKIAKSGWPAGAEKIERMAEGFEIPDSIKESITLQPQQILALAGDEVDVGLYLSGEPECMQDWEHAATDGVNKIVKIVLNISASCDTHSDIMIRRACGALALANALELVGYSVEIVAASCCSNLGGLIWETTLKHSDQVLDLLELSTSAHPAFLRRGWFAVLEQNPDDEIRGLTYGGYGSPIDYPDDKTSIVINNKWRSDRAMLDALQSKVTEFFNL